MPDATGLAMGLNGSKKTPTPMPGKEDGSEKGSEDVAASLEVDNTTVRNDEDLGGGPALTGKKRKAGMTGSAGQNGSVAKRVLRSNSTSLHADAKITAIKALDVSKSDSLERKQCEPIVEAAGSMVPRVDTSNCEEDRELVNMNVNDVSEGSAKCPDHNVEVSGVAVMEFAHSNGSYTQGSDTELDEKQIKADVEVSAIHEEQNESIAGTGGMNVDESQANKGSHAPCQGEVIDPSAVANDAKISTSLSTNNLTVGSESGEQEGPLVGTEGVLLQKDENDSHIDDVHKESEVVSLTENGRCIVDSQTDLTECTKQEGRGSLVDETKDVSQPDIVFRRRNSISRKTCETKQVQCEEELRVERRVTRSATVRQREVSVSSCKTEATLGSKEKKGDVIAHYTRKVSSKRQVESNASTKKQTVKGKVVDRRGSGIPANEDHADTTVNGETENEVKINLKSQLATRVTSIVKKATEAVVKKTTVDQNISTSAVTERNDTEHTDSEGVKSENKTYVKKSVLSVGAKIVASKKRILESGLDKIGRKSPIAMPSSKKTRNTSSDIELEQPNKSSGQDHIGKNCGSDNKRILRERRHRSQTANSNRPSNHSNQNTSKLSQDESDDDETDSDTSYRKTRRGRRTRGANSHVLKKQEDSSDSEDVIVTRKSRQKRIDSEHKQRAGSRLQRSSGPSKTGCSVTKSESSSLSRKAGKEEMKAPEGKGKTDKASILKSSGPTEHINAGTVREEKQKISEQIKAILLDAGWTIDLRPRNGRNYMDSVYIPPSGKGSYWSVTKAYYAFREGVGSEQKDSSKSQSSSKTSGGTPGEKHASSSSGCTLPEDILSRLKRVVVNKRRPKVVLQKLRRKHALLKKFKRSKGKSKEKKNKIAKSRRPHLGNERKKRGGCALLARGSNQEAGSSADGFVPYKWKRTVLSWLIDLDVLSVNTKLKCMDERHSKVLLEGLITREGINCSCCSNVLTVLEFVAHAGGEVKKPYKNIFVDGQDIDLLHCLINGWNMQSDSEKQAFFVISTEGDDPNDDTCGICGDGGNLMCCDGCPSTFHMSCLGLEAIPSDDWRCANCTCKFCHQHSSHGAEDIADVDCSLRTCSQCEKKYHEACSLCADSGTGVSSQSGSLFCQQSCKLLFEELQNLLAVEKVLEPDFSCRLVQRIHEDVPETVLALDEKVECNSKIAVALSLMDECFLPIVDQRTGINLIRNVVYSCGSNFVRLDFHGFYIFVLERGDEIIAAASVRIHGTKLAEMPFIGTRDMYRRQGMCRRLLDGIEMILSSLNVEKLIIPAITELVDTWTSKFGFSPLEVSEKQEVKSISMLVFPGTGLLQKSLLKKTLPDELPCSQGADAVSSGKPFDATNEDSTCSFASADPQGSGVTEPVDSSKNVNGTCNDG